MSLALNKLFLEFGEYRALFMKNSVPFGKVSFTSYFNHVFRTWYCIDNTSCRSRIRELCFILSQNSVCCSTIWYTNFLNLFFILCHLWTIFVIVIVINKKTFETRSYNNFMIDYLPWSENSSADSLIARDFQNDLYFVSCLILVWLQNHIFSLNNGIVVWCQNKIFRLW